MSERTKVTDKIMQYAQLTSGMWCFKTHGSDVQGAGLPDLIVCWHGRFIAVECKSPSGGRASKLQEKVLWQIRQAGGMAAVVRSFNEFLEVIREMEEVKA